MFKIINIILLLSAVAYGQTGIKWRQFAPQTKQTIIDSIAVTIQDSIAFPVDTTALKALNMDEGRVAYLKQLSATNANGGGWFAVVDSGYPETAIETGHVFSHPTAAMQWLRDGFPYDDIDILNSGAFNDSTNRTATKTAIMNAMNLSVAYGTQCLAPAGQYITDDILIPMGTSFIGDGAGKTRFYTGTTSFMHPDTTSYFADTLRNNLLIENLVVIGPYSWNDTIGVPSGIYIDSRDYNGAAGHFPMNNCIIRNSTVSGVRGEAINIIGAKYGLIDDCDVYNSSQTAFTVVNNISEVTNSHCWDVRNGIELWVKDYHGSDLTPYARMDNNVISTIRGYGIKGISYGGDISITNNEVIGRGDSIGTSSQDHHGITLATGTNVGDWHANFNIRNNTVKKYKTGVVISDGALTFEIDNLIFQSNEVDSSWTANLYFRDMSSVKNTVIKNNTFSNWAMIGSAATARGALMLADAVSDPLITGNDFYCTGADTTAIDFPNTADSVRIINNYFSDVSGRFGLIEWNTSFTNEFVYGNTGFREVLGAMRGYNPVVNRKQVLSVSRTGINFGTTIVGEDAFDGSALLDTVLLDGALATDRYFVTPHDTTDQITLKAAKGDSVIFVRKAGGTASIGYDFFRIK